VSADGLHVDCRVKRGAFTLELAAAIPLAGVTAVFGPSGSGKSTLLRTIAGFERPVRGTLRCAGETWYDGGRGVDLAAHRRPVGLVFQESRLFEHLTVDGNLAYAERRQRGAGPDRAAVLDALDLAPLLPRRPADLSGGERKRAALGRTLLSHPRLLLLDEPLTGLDRARKADILPYLEAVTERFALPTLYVSHDLDEVARLADRVLVLQDGQLPPAWAHLPSPEALELGPLAAGEDDGVILKGRAHSRDARLRQLLVDVGRDRFVLPLPHHELPSPWVRFRIRARDVSLALAEPQGLSIRNRLPCRLVDLSVNEATGRAEATVQLDEGRLRAELTLAAVEELGLEAGMAVYALVKSVSVLAPE